MALEETNGNGMVMPVSPMYGNGNGGNNGGFGDNGWWILVLFILLGGWNNNGFGGGFGGMGSGSVGNLYPWMNQSNQISDGFRDQMLNSTINGIQSAVTSGFGDVQTALCSVFAGVNASINGAQNAIAQQLYGNQIADMQQMFGMQSALQQCCCDNKAGLADVKYTIATENCADRAAISDGIRDVLTANANNTQRILDQLCADKIDAKNEKIADLERQLTMANLAASQTAQTAAIRAGQVAEIDAMYNRLRDCPVPTMPVYGSQPIFTCPNNNNGCGCGCGM